MVRGWEVEYTSSVTLGGIGLSVDFASSARTNKGIEYWTSSGNAYVCGNNEELEKSSVFFAN
jgi:hypothetical protein